MLLCCLQTGAWNAPGLGCRMLLSAAEEGAGLRAQTEALQDFLPAGGSAAALAAALAELERVLQNPAAEHTFAWLHDGNGGAQERVTAQGPGKAGGRTGDEAAAAARDGGPPMSAKRQLPATEHAVCSSSGLRAAAAEFRPGAQAPSLACQLGSLKLGAGAAGGALAAGTGNKANADASWLAGTTGSLEDGWQTVDNEAVGFAGWGPANEASSGPPQPHSAGRWAAAAAAAEAQAAAGGGLAAGAFLAVLADQFPLWSAEALRHLFEEQGGDLEATVSTLCSLESELEGQQQAGGWGNVRDGSSAPSAAGNSEASFTEADFPSLGALGGSLAGSSTGSGGREVRGSVRGGYASAAAAAADLPAERRQRGAVSLPPHRVAGSAAPPSTAHPQSRAAAGAAAASQGPAPIWQQQEGVARFATGQALAAQYADLRTDARDHARLRNAYFQQVWAGAGWRGATSDGQTSVFSFMSVPSSPGQLHVLAACTAQRTWKLHGGRNTLSRCLLRVRRCLALASVWHAAAASPLTPFAGHTGVHGRQQAAGQGAWRQGPVAQRADARRARGRRSPAICRAKRGRHVCRRRQRSQRGCAHH